MFARLARFWLGFFVAFSVYAAVIIYGLDKFGPNWGPGTTFLVAMLVAAALGLVATQGFVAGLRAFSREPQSLGAALAGTIVGAVTLPGAQLLGMVIPNTLVESLWFTVVAFPLSMLSALMFKGKE